MPELPEVETIVRYLKDKILGEKVLKIINLFPEKVLIKNKNLEGEKILDIYRRGKTIVISFSNNKKIFIHLKMTGQLILISKKEKSDLKSEIDKHTRAIFELENYFLIFKDVRKFGWIKEDESFIQKLGIEPLEPSFTIKKLKEMLLNSNQKIKLFLMDQKKIAGIGNIYANEILFEAKINPQKKANSLKDEEIKRLFKAIKKILRRGIKYEGTTSRFYLKPDKTKGRYQEKFLVYKRENLPCKRCQTKIKKIMLGNRSTFYCPNCQK